MDIRKQLIKEINELKVNQRSFIKQLNKIKKDLEKKKWIK